MRVIRKAVKWAAAAAVIAIALSIAVPRFKEKAELKRRRAVCEEYLASADTALGFEVEFDIIWEKEVYGRDDYEIRNIYPENAGEDDLKIVERLLDSLTYDPDAYINTTTESLDACGEDAMRIKITCKNGEYILLTWSFGGSECLLRAYDGNDKWQAYGGYIVSADAANALRACGGLPPIPTLEQVIGREEIK